MLDDKTLFLLLQLHCLSLQPAVVVILVSVCKDEI